MEMIAVELGIGALLYILLSLLLQRKFGNPMRLAEIQTIMNKKYKELTELSKTADQALLSAKQKEITPLMSEMMKIQYKPMFVVMPVFLVIYYLILPALFPTSPTVQLLSFTLSYKNYFIAVSFVAGLALSLCVSAYDKARVAKRQQAQAAPQQLQA